MYPGLNVALRDHGQDLQEYDDETDVEGAEHTRFVEAASGATLTVEFRTDRRFLFAYNELAFHIYLDGKFAEGKHFTPHLTHGGHSDKWD